MIVGGADREAQGFDRDRFEHGLRADFPFLAGEFNLVAPNPGLSLPAAKLADLWPVLEDLGIRTHALQQLSFTSCEMGSVWEFNARGAEAGGTPFALVFFRRHRGIPHACRIYLSSRLASGVSERPARYFPLDFKTALPDHMIHYYVVSRSGDPKAFIELFTRDQPGRIALEDGCVLDLVAEDDRRALSSLLADAGVIRSVYHSIYEGFGNSAVEVSSYRESDESPELATPGLMCFGLSGRSTAVSSVDRRFISMRMYGDVWRLQRK